MSFRWGVAGLALALAGCPVEQVQGGRYACTMDGGEDQCPGTWRCGFEGFCHALGDARPWRCQTDDHCENGWQCGLNAQRDGGECHDPTVGAAYPCASSAQCSAQWHCGAERVCYDRTVPFAYACRADAGDCTNGWRCGRDGHCQNQAQGAAYPCREADAGLNDGWCEQGWRCAPEGTCIDPAQDALGPAPAPLDAGERIHPLGPNAPVDRFAVSPTYSSGFGTGVQTLAWVANGALFAQVENQVTQTRTQYALGPYTGSAFFPQGSRGEHETGVPPLYSSPDDKNRVFIATEDAGVDFIVLEADGGATRRPVNMYYPTRRLTLGSARADLAPTLVAFQTKPRVFSLLFGDTYVLSDHSWQDDGVSGFLWDTAAPNNEIIDARAVRPRDDVVCVFGVDKRGLFVSQKTYGTTPPYTYDFEALEIGAFTNDHCGPPTAATHRITGLSSVGRDWLAAASLPIDGGTAHVAILDLRALWTQLAPDSVCASATGNPCLPSDRIPVSMRMAPCAVCPGDELLDFTVVANAANEPSVEVRCGRADAGTSGFFTVAPAGASGQCVRTLLDGESGLFSHPRLRNPEGRVGNVVAWSSLDDGYIWRGPRTLDAVATLFDRPAAQMALRGSARTDVMAFAATSTGTYSDGTGFVAAAGAPVAAAVEGAASWVVGEDRTVIALADAGSVAAAPIIGLVGTTVTPFAPPYTAVATQRGDAPGQVLVVGAGASVFSAEMGASLAAVSLRAVAPSLVQSMAFPPKSPAGTYLQGYAVTPNGVFRVTAQTATRWVFEQVALPQSLAPAEVWFEGARARVGFSDGTVYALPSRVAIAGPLGDGVVDFAQACDQQFALSSAGLYRLERVPNQAVGAWRPVALPAGFGASTFTRGRIHGLGDTLYVFARSGEAAAVTLPACAPP